MPWYLNSGPKLRDQEGIIIPKAMNNMSARAPRTPPTMAPVFESGFTPTAHILRANVQ